MFDGRCLWIYVSCSRFTKIYCILNYTRFFLSTNRPDDNVDSIVEWMISNFEHNYKTNRAPFGVYLHAAWFLKGDHYFEAYDKYFS